MGFAPPPGAMMRFHQRRWILHSDAGDRTGKGVAATFMAPGGMGSPFPGAMNRATTPLEMILYRWYCMKVHDRAATPEMICIHIVLYESPSSRSYAHLYAVVFW